MHVHFRPCDTTEVLNSRTLPFDRPKVKAYTFEIELLDSSDPVITRTVHIPRDFTFQEVHHVLQHAFAWMGCHHHGFSLEGGGPGSRVRLDITTDGNPVLDDGSFALGERDVKLEDFFDPEGQYRQRVMLDEEMLPLIYEYDYGDGWEHHLDFKGETEIDVERPVFIAATGYPPAEDCGGVYGWDNVKAAFAEKNPDAEQERLREWTIWRMAKPDGSDPFWRNKRKYNPLREIDIKVLNMPRRWNERMNMAGL